MEEYIVQSIESLNGYKVEINTYNDNQTNEYYVHENH